MLRAKDSLQAKAALADIKDKYQGLRDKINNPENVTQAGKYIGSLDTLTTALKFLDQAGLSGNIKNALSKTQSLQDRFQQADAVKNFIRSRRRQLKEQLEKLGWVNKLKKINKTSFYYSEQIKEYASLLKDKKKLERKAIALLSQTNAFKNFFRRNSALAGLFRLPGDPADPSAQANLAGLQTRNAINSLIQQQLTVSGPGAQQAFSQNMAAAQSQLQELKNKVSKFGGTSSDAEIPEGFTHNPARTKTFFQRIQVQTDFQTNKHNNTFPVSSDIGLGLSYLINANSNVSIGSSFKVGWGTGFNHIRISSQGIALRAGFNYRLKGNLFIAGNYEQNYFSEIRNINQLRDHSSWKSSALLGLSRKFKAGKKREGRVSLLYDFFYKRAPIKTQALTVRFAYNLK